MDPSLPMLKRGQALHAGMTNIRWFHWMDHAVVFPRLVGVLETDGVLAMIEGDRPHQPPWQAAWMVFLRRWLERVGLRYDKDEFGDAVTAHERWIDVTGWCAFVFDYQQSVADFVACQHSRATWTINQLGEAVAAEFDRELTELLTPFAGDGQLEFSVQTNLVWGTPRSALVEP